MTRKPRSWSRAAAEVTEIAVRPHVRVLSTQRIDTTRLRLRPPAPADIRQIARLVGNWQVAYWLVRVPFPYDVDQARAWVERSSQDRADGIGWPFLIERRDDRAVVGSVDLSIEGERTTGALGYWIGEEFWGRGYASEACDGMMRFAFEIAMLDIVTANVLPENHRSVRVLEKAGFRRLGRRREEAYDHAIVDTEHFAIDRAEWQRRA